MHTYERKTNKNPDWTRHGGLWERHDGGARALTLVSLSVMSALVTTVQGVEGCPWVAAIVSGTEAAVLRLLEDLAAA